MDQTCEESAELVIEVSVVVYRKKGKNRNTVSDSHHQANVEGTLSGPSQKYCDGVGSKTHLLDPV